MPNFVIVLFLSLSFVSSTGQAAGEHQSEMKTIEGSVWYRERIALPPQAEIKVSLEDVAKQDVAAEQIALTHFSAQGGPPWSFNLTYDPRKLDAKGRYALRARIELEGRLMFTNTESVPAFDDSRDGPVKIRVDKVRSAQEGQNKPAPAADASLTNTYWKPVELNGNPVGLGAGQKELYMVLSSETADVKGFSGCNRFQGQYEQSGNALSFRPLASTRKACLEGMDVEQIFLKKIGEIHGKTGYFRVTPGLDEENERFLKFIRAYFG